MRSRGACCARPLGRKSISDAILFLQSCFYGADWHDCKNSLSIFRWCMTFLCSEKCAVFAAPQRRMGPHASCGWQPAMSGCVPLMCVALMVALRRFCSRNHPRNSQKQAKFSFNVLEVASRWLSRPECNTRVTFAFHHFFSRPKPSKIELCG